MSDACLTQALTVVLLTYNCAHRIRPVVERLCGLGVPVVAVDNASRDGTPAVLESYPGVEVVRLARNMGAAGRNVGVQHVRTRYVAFCDDDGWYERDGLCRAVAALDEHPRLALVSARILVAPDARLDPICAEMAASPLPDRHGIPGRVLLGFMAGAAVVRVAAFRAVGGYDPRFFIGGEEETLAVELARAGWQLRYRDDVVAHHQPSIANASAVRPYLMRNTLVNCWLHRRATSALRWTGFVLAATPKDRNWPRALAMAFAATPWVLRRRRPLPVPLDRDFATLDRRRFAARAR
jgi:GT2 family glycosyltransferase